MLMKEKFYAIYSKVHSIINLDDLVTDNYKYNIDNLNQYIVDSSNIIHTDIIAVQNELKTKINHEILEHFIYALVILFDKQIAQFIFDMNIESSQIPHLLNRCCLEHTTFQSNNAERRILEYLQQVSDIKSPLDQYQHELAIIYMKLLIICFHDLKNIEKHRRKLYRLLYKEEIVSSHNIFLISTQPNMRNLKHSYRLSIISVILFITYIMISSALWLNISNNVYAKLNHIIEMMDIK